VTDPFYPMGSGDRLEVAAMGLHVVQMTGMAAMRSCFDAGILGLEGYALEPACNAASSPCRRTIRSKRSACGPRGSTSCGAARSSPEIRPRPARESQFCRLKTASAHGS